MWFAVPCALAVATVALPAAARAQSHEPALFADGVAGHVALLGANAAVSGLTAGVLRWWRGGSFRAGFVGGAAGGAVVYGGKVVAVQDVPGAGMAGRQLAAVGASAVRNAALGDPVLSLLTLPLGPLRLQIEPESRGDVRVSVDLAGVAALAGALLVYDARIDWTRSLAAGAPVLLVRDSDLAWHGRFLWGTILISDPGSAPGAHHYPRVLAHETVHLIQYDHFLLLWSEPVEAVLLSGRTPGRASERRIYLGLHVPLGSPVTFLPDHWNPIEIEAHFLARTWNYTPDSPGSRELLR